MLLGEKGEKRAKKFLIENGCNIIKTNFHSRFGEIDIIAETEETIHFIEVKTSINYNPLFRITPSKYKKLIKTIDYFLYLYPTTKKYQLDAIAVTKDIEWIKNITY